MCFFCFVFWFIQRTVLAVYKQATIAEIGAELTMGYQVVWFVYWKEEDLPRCCLGCLCLDDGT